MTLHPYVRAVVCEDTNTDITTLLNDEAFRYKFDAVGFLGGLIAESGLREHAARERAWPDVSYGLAQPTVKWHGKVVPGVTLAWDGTVQDTPNNRILVRDYFFDAARTIRYVAPFYSALVVRWGNALEAWLRWNKPNLEGYLNPNRANYVRGLSLAEGYRAGEEPMPPAPAPADTYVVSPEMRQHLADVGDVPAGDEVYWIDQPKVKMSVCPGKKGLYVYNNQANITYKVGAPLA